MSQFLDDEREYTEEEKKYYFLKKYGQNAIEPMLIPGNFNSDVLPNKRWYNKEDECIMFTLETHHNMYFGRGL